MKTLWVVSGGVEAVPGIRRAREMGLHVVVSDVDPNAPGFEFADDHVIASTYDAEQTLAAAQRYDREVRRVDGVMCMAADVPVTVATVAEGLKLPGLSRETACLAADKVLMKEHLVRHDIPVPWFSAVSSPGELRDVFDSRRTTLVIKPVDSRGARGVWKLDEQTPLPAAFEQARAQSPTQRVLVEEFVAGPQISTESVVLPGTATTPGFIDRNYEFLERFAPHMIENGGEQPSALAPADQTSVAGLAERAARAMGIVNHVAKGDLVLSADGPKVIEIAARLSGGWMSSDQIPLGTGVDIVGAAIKLALGDGVTTAEVTPNQHRGVAIRYWFPEPGRIVAIRGAERFRTEKWVHKLHFFVNPGDVVERVTSHTKRAGFVITTANTRQDALARAREVIDAVQIATTTP